MYKQIIVKPIISEKSERLTEKLNQYSFVVNKAANKLEVSKAVEEMFPGVNELVVGTTTVK